MHLNCRDKKNKTYSKRPDIWNTRMIVQEKWQKLPGQWEL